MCSLRLRKRPDRQQPVVRGQRILTGFGRLDPMSPRDGQRAGSLERNCLREKSERIVAAKPNSISLNDNLSLPTPTVLATFFHSNGVQPQ